MGRIIERVPTPGSDRWEWPSGLHPVLRQVLARRPMRSPAELELELKNLIPVGEFDELAAAVELLLHHRNGRIVIVGDFDADGATSAALMYLALRDFRFGQVSYYIPDRFTLGYGLTPELIERVRALAPDLIVTVDNGISSVTGVAAAREAGIDVLITDHHLAPAVLPAANAIVNPNAPGSSFRGKHLAGVGVAFYLMAALGRALGNPGCVAAYLDLVALGTVADLVPLDHANRILVGQGLRRIRAARCRPGLRALCAVANVEPADAGSRTLAYQVAPRLNAAGRLEDMSVGVRLLVTDSGREAAELASRLDALNRERRELEARMRGEALAQVDADQLVADGEVASVVCLFQADWHEGLVGLVASKVRERHHRPTIAFARTANGGLKGSGRSIPGFHLRDALADVDAAHPGMIERFGGHAMAAGLTLRADALAVFQAAMERIGAQRLAPEMLAEQVLTDGVIAPDHMNLEVAMLLRDAVPWGQAFPEPSFDGRFELLAQRRLKDAHLKMTLKPVAGQRRLDAIAFNHPPAEWPPGTQLRLVYRLAVNDYFAAPDVQLIVEHIETDQ